VGYIGGWTKQVFGSEQLALGGLAGAMVATFFTFLPSFIFILIGGPAIEASRYDIKLSAPLTAITAAVVGVIINLAVFFAYHVLWPQGITQAFNMQTLFTGFQWISLLIGVAAFIALWRYKIGIITVIGACGAAGLVYKLLV
ncbi:MAG: chromate transporter, partial [Proteobacteria bacterium]|nr:chromate transporter [Pseudomonadota bacterium]